MNIIDSTSTSPTADTPTFEQFAASLGIAADDPRSDTARVLWELEQLANASYPTVIPPCPSWCTLPAGHEYDSYLPEGPGKVQHSRFHTADVGTAGFRVDAMETHTTGITALSDITIAVPDGLQDLDVTTARSLAADLLAAADLLESIERERS